MAQTSFIGLILKTINRLTDTDFLKTIPIFLCCSLFLSYILLDKSPINDYDTD
jgi:hypothetical protein